MTGLHCRLIVFCSTGHRRLICVGSYATGPEILGYFKDVVEKFNLMEFAKLNHTVVGAWWDDARGQWKVKIQPNDKPEEEAFFDYAHVLVNATGVLK